MRIVYLDSENTAIAAESGIKLMEAKQDATRRGAAAFRTMSDQRISGRTITRIRTYSRNGKGTWRLEKTEQYNGSNDFLGIRGAWS